jgi:serine protease Do
MNGIVRFTVILFIPLLMGIGIGYAVKSGVATPANEPSFVGSPDEHSEPSISGEAQNAQESISNSRETAITRAVAKVSPAVVGINVLEVREFRDPFWDMFGNDPFFRRFFGDRTFRQQVRGLGSGIVISPDGYIVTNDHVAGNAKEIEVTFSGGSKMKAELVGTDQLTDVALLKVDAKNLPYVTLGNSDDLIIGEWAIALGNPFGLFAINDKPTVTVGVISSVGMNLGQQNNRVYKDMIETDAAINSGNSGGPLVNANGEVVGMNTLIYTAGQSQTFVGYGFAIPINKVKRVVAELRTKGTVTRDFWTGFESQPVDARVARYFGLARVEGIIISDVTPNSPAEKAGLKVGDIVLEANGTKTNSEQDLLALLVDAKAGEVLNLRVYRERRLFNVSLRLERRPTSGVAR